ncbi:GNAT family N-acetyltransferase [Streptomyces sp. NPDC050560]|uniref:GNAT family N-acetyltransferase n=1 Tax=Streptomyces sp. NPDC050560 TaxID=3365630 RepID=UPI0037AD33A5
MTIDGIALSHATNIEAVWSTLIDVYSEVRAEQLHQPHYSVERYAERLSRHGTEPGWEAVIGFDEDEPVGYAYVNTLEPEDRWWRRMTTPLPQGCSERPTVALKEIMVRVPWRGTGTARYIHDGLLAHRQEEQVSLLVNPLSGNGKVKALYERWGYQEISVQQPSADGPVLTAMLREIRPSAPRQGQNIL